MGAQLASLRDGAARSGEDSPTVEQRRTFIDASGNLQPPGGASSSRLFPGGSARRSRDVELGHARAGGFRPGTGGFRTLNDLATEPQQHSGQGGAGVQPGWRGRLQELRQQTAEAQWWDPRFMMRGVLFPASVMRSVQGVLIGLQITMFLASCWIIAPRAFVTPSSNAMWKWGSPSLVMDRCIVMVGGRFLVELRRIFVPIFLHKDLLHIAFNVVAQLTSGPPVLEFQGAGGFAILFIASGVCGVLLATAFSHIGVGASTACYGLSGAYIAQVWLIWPTMTDELWRWMMKALAVIVCCSTLVWEIARWNSLDHLGHLGGLLSGFLCAVLLAGRSSSTGASADTPLPANMQKRRQICGGVLAFATLACVVKVYLVGSDFLQEGETSYTWKERCDLEWQRGYTQPS